MTSRFSEFDIRAMTLALHAAQRSIALGEVPVGAVLCQNERIIAVASNTKETDQDPTGHAEINVLKRASRIEGRWRLLDCTLYVTLEPCFMCAGALIQARLNRLVVGTLEPKSGAIRSLANLANDSRLNHQLHVDVGLCRDACRLQLQSFFKRRRM